MPYIQRYTVYNSDIFDDDFDCFSVSLYRVHALESNLLIPYVQLAMSAARMPLTKIYPTEEKKYRMRMTAFYAWDGDGGDWNFFEIHTDWHIHTVIPYCVRLYGMWSVRLPISSSYIIRCLVNSIFVWIQFSIVAIVVRWSPLGIRSTMQKIWPEISLDNRAPSDVWWINARIAVAARVVWGQISGLWTVTSCSVQIFQIVCLKILESSLILPTQHIFVCFHSSRKHEIIRLSTDVDNSHTGSIRTPSTAFLWNTHPSTCWCGWMKSGGGTHAAKRTIHRVCCICNQMVEQT